MIIAYKAGNIAEAHIVSGMLEAAGIETHVGGHYLQGGVGEIAAMDFANVQIHESDFEQARALILAYENNEPDNVKPAESAETLTHNDPDHRG